MRIRSPLSSPSRLTRFTFVLALAAQHCGSTPSGGSGEGTDAAETNDAGGSSEHHDAGGSRPDGASGADGGEQTNDAGSGGQDGSTGHDGGVLADGSPGTEDGGGGDDGSVGHDSGGHDSGHDAPSHDAGTGSGTGSGTGNGGDSGVLVSCSTDLQLGPIVPATGYNVLFVQGNNTYVPNSDYKSWTVIPADGASATTGPIPMPAGVTSMQILEAERAYDGTTLVLFENGSSADFATFWNGTTFSTPVPLPATTVSIHADAERHLFAVDENNELWDGRSGTFLSRGIVPLQNGTANPGPLGYLNWGWTVSPTAIVTTVYAGYDGTTATPSLNAQTFDATLSWSAPVIVEWSMYETDWFSSMTVVGGDDGSVHVAYAHSYYLGMTEDTGTTVLYARWSGTGTSWQVVGVPNYGGVEAIVANSYADVELLVAGSQPDPNEIDTDYVLWWATPLCTSTPTAWWETVQIQVGPGYYPAGTYPGMALNAAGYPSFFLWQTSGTEIQTSY